MIPMIRIYVFVIQDIKICLLKTLVMHVLKYLVLQNAKSASLEFAKNVKVIVVIETLKLVSAKQGILR